MIVYDPSLPAAQRPTAAQMAGKILVIKHPVYANNSSLGDYEFRSDNDRF
jgi:hypothetical protein